MKVMLGAAIVAFSIGIGSGYAGDGDGNSATTLFTSIQNERAAKARTAALHTQAAAPQNSDALAQASGNRSQGLGTWLFSVFSLP
jgi:hypothetical protein